MVRQLTVDVGTGQAPGEAEAELAYMNRHSIIHAIMSDDVDTFLFGAFRVIRK
jgi:holliday junction resolvase YEN1